MCVSDSVVFVSISSEKTFILFLNFPIAQGLLEEKKKKKHNKLLLEQFPTQLKL